MGSSRLQLEHWFPYDAAVRLNLVMADEDKSEDDLNVVTEWSLGVKMYGWLADKAANTRLTNTINKALAEHFGWCDITSKGIEAFRKATITRLEDETDAATANTASEITLEYLGFRRLGILTSSRIPGAR